MFQPDGRLVVEKAVFFEIYASFVSTIQTKAMTDRNTDLSFFLTKSWEHIVTIERYARTMKVVSFV